MPPPLLRNNLSPSAFSRVIRGRSDSRLMGGIFSCATLGAITHVTISFYILPSPQHPEPLVLSSSSLLIHVSAVSLFVPFLHFPISYRRWHKILFEPTFIFLFILHSSIHHVPCCLGGCNSIWMAKCIRYAFWKKAMWPKCFIHHPWPGLHRRQNKQARLPHLIKSSHTDGPFSLPRAPLQWNSESRICFDEGHLSE